MLKAHEQAMEDLKNSQGSAADKDKMIMVLSTEKTRLEGVVEDLEAEKKKMAKQLSELRDEVAKLKKEIRRYGKLLRSGERAVMRARGEADKSTEKCNVMSKCLLEATTLEAELRDDAAVSKGECEALLHQVARGLDEHKHTQSLLKSVQDERDQ